MTELEKSVISCKGIEAILRNIFRDLFNTEVDGDVSPEEVRSWDSLSHIKLIIQLEMVFGVRVPSDDIGGLYSSFKTVADYLCSELKG